MPDRRAFVTSLVIAGVASEAVAHSKSVTPVMADSPETEHTHRIAQTDLSVSRIGYGCASLTSWNTDPFNGEDLRKASQAIHAAMDCGVTLFDHADLYAFGKAEAVFGAVLKQSPGLRNRIVIQSKCGQRFPSGWKPGDPIRVDLSRQHIVDSTEGSLQRLGTDHLDILLLHAPDALVRPAEVAQALEQLRRSGKVRYFGVSNHNATQIALLKKAVREPIVINQIHLGLGYAYPLADGMDFTLQLNQGLGGEQAGLGLAASGTLDYCRLNDIQVQAWSPLRGVLNPPADAPPERKRTAELLTDLARKKNTTPAAVALAWLQYHPAAIVPLIGSPEPERIAENCAANQVMLERDEWYSLFAASLNLRPLLVS